MKWFLLHSPDFLCFYRAISCILALFLGNHPVVPWIFSSALISDLLDGWIFRRYVQNDPDWHLWHTLPISSIDPYCDFTMMVCGVIYAAHYVFGHGLLGCLIAALLTTSFSLGLNRIPYLWPYRSDLVWTVCITTVTHGSLLIMHAGVIFAWYANSSYWALGAGLTIALFYLVFARIGNRQRLVRHPPANWRT